MSITVAPTLAFMADVYRRPTTGGRESDRFTFYVRAAAESLPVHGYNPMTTKPVLETVEALIDIEAEDRLVTVANDTANRLGYAIDAEMHITVATPGMWTDRLATEVDHRLRAPDPGGVLLWCGDVVDGGVPLRRRGCEEVGIHAARAG